MSRLSLGVPIVAINPEYAAALDKALEYAKQLYADSSFTQTQVTNKGVRILMKDVPGGTLPITRGELTYPPEFTLDDILCVLTLPEPRKTWDARFEGMVTVEEYGPGIRESGLVHSQQKGQWPVISGRDFVVAWKVYIEGDSTYFIQTSVVDPRFGPQSGRVRAHLTVAAWIIKPSATGKGLDVTYIVQADPAGTLPSALVRLVSAETPSCVGSFLSYLQKSYVRESTTGTAATTTTTL